MIIATSPHLHPNKPLRVPMSDSDLELTLIYEKHNGSATTLVLELLMGANHLQAFIILMGIIS